MYQRIHKQKHIRIRILRHTIRALQSETGRQALQILSLKASNADLQEALDSADCRAEEVNSRATARIKSIERDRDYERLEAKRRQSNMEDDIQTATKKLERARADNDEYGEARALQELRRIG